MAPTSIGENQRGQLGRGDTNTTGDEPDEMGDNLIAVDLGTGEVASALALGDEYTCVLLASGDVKVTTVVIIDVNGTCCWV